MAKGRTQKNAPKPNQKTKKIKKEKKSTNKTDLKLCLSQTPNKEEISEIKKGKRGKQQKQGRESVERKKSKSKSPEKEKQKKVVKKEFNGDYQHAIIDSITHLKSKASWQNVNQYIKDRFKNYDDNKLQLHLQLLEKSGKVIFSGTSFSIWEDFQDDEEVEKQKQDKLQQKKEKEEQKKKIEEQNQQKLAKKSQPKSEKKLVNGVKTQNVKSSLKSKNDLNEEMLDEERKEQENYNKENSDLNRIDNEMITEQNNQKLNARQKRPSKSKFSNIQSESNQIELENAEFQRQQDILQFLSNDQNKE